MDSWLLFRKGKNTTDGAIGVLIDDKICAATSSLSTEENVASKILPNKG